MEKQDALIEGLTSAAHTSSVHTTSLNAFVVCSNNLQGNGLAAKARQSDMPYRCSSSMSSRT